MTKKPVLKKIQSKLSWNVPITENWTTGGNDFKIKGIAINETTTRNGVEYRGEELEKSVHTLRNKPILKDHKNEIDGIVGRTTENVLFDSTNRNIMFEGVIMDKNVQEMISDGRINSVSIGAMVSDLEKNEAHDHETFTARGIEFIELSLVAVPADPHATFDKAIMESFQEDIDITKRPVIASSVFIPSGDHYILTGKDADGKTVMSTEFMEDKTKMEKEMPVKLEEVQTKAVIPEVTKLQEELKALKEELKVQEVANLKAQIAELKATKEKTSVKAEVKEVKKDETKGEFITQKENKTFDNYTVEYSEFGKGVSLWKDPSTYTHPRLRRD